MMPDDNGVDDPEHFDKFLRLWFKAATQRHDALKLAESVMRSEVHDLREMWASCTECRIYAVEAEGRQRVMRLCWLEMEAAVIGDERCP